MFYSVFVLGKKGPLARVWLAAHWDKKITKAQILETNIVESVDSILQPRVKLSLRTSSHLLLGIVRIYARKTLYLLQDCQDAAFKIKSAFRPGAVDMPDGKTEAAISAITLPECLDFVNDFDLIAEPPIQIEHPHTNANIRSITLQEDVSSIHIDDPLLHEVRDWGDLSSVRGAASGDDHTLHDSTLQIPQKESHPLDIFDRPIDDDGFLGTGGADGDVDDMFALPVPPEAQEQMQAEKEQREREAREAEEQQRPLSRMSERSDYSAPASMAPSGPPSTPGSVPPPPDMDEEMPQDNLFGRPQPIETGEIGLDEPAKPAEPGQETMVLEPLEGGPGVERRRKRRRRLGLLVDEIKTLTGEEMKSQLSDTTDIVATLDLAPPTKKLMHWKKTGGSEKLFSLPERPLMSKVLSLYYSRNLVTSRIETEEEIPEGDLLNGDADDEHILPPRSVRRSERIPHMEELQLEKMPAPSSPSKYRKPAKKKDTAEKTSPAKKRRRQDKENEGSQTPRPKTPRAAESERFANHTNDFEITENSIHAARDGSTIPSFGGYRPSGQSVRFQDEDDFQDNYEQPLSVGPVEEMMPDETAEQFEERVRNKRTNVLLRLMANQLEEGEMTFSQLVKSNRRKQVAQKFYSLLVLKKQQAIELSQDMSVEYGELFIRAGPRYEAAVSSL
ncbi:Double-strand-break repair protein rad21 -like protein [Halotydeus destructor]|nr:Double-strand-break repair protein rad21 -like protein [Halotydeus destructor]